MPRLILPKADLKRMIRERRECGGDRYDEVWDGVYAMSPIANNEHMNLIGALAFAFRMVRPDATILPGCNVSDQPENWLKNYRVPDVAVFLPGNPAEDRDSHWYGGPDLAVEILSPGDRARKKFHFYARVGVRELLLVDRHPWRLELYRRDDGPWIPVGQSDIENPAILTSTTLPLSIRLISGPKRPRIELTQTTDGQTWLA